MNCSSLTSWMEKWMNSFTQINHSIFIWVFYCIASHRIDYVRCSSFYKFRFHDFITCSAEECVWNRVNNSSFSRRGVPKHEIEFVNTCQEINECVPCAYKCLFKFLSVSLDSNTLLSTSPLNSPHSSDRIKKCVIPDSIVWWRSVAIITWNVLVDITCGTLATIIFDFEKATEELCTLRAIVKHLLSAKKTIRNACVAAASQSTAEIYRSYQFYGCVITLVFTSRSFGASNWALITN